jgi:hypothetical protein
MRSSVVEIAEAAGASQRRTSEAMKVAGVSATPAKLHARRGVGARLAPRTVSSRRSVMPDARGATYR